MHVAGYTLDLVFTGAYGEGDLAMEETKITPLSWTDHYLVSFRLATPPPPTSLQSSIQGN